MKRDSTATVTAWGSRRHKRLMVNGVGMTYLTPITKMMAHLPLASLAEPPRRALTICFGVGTSFRSTLSWGIDAWAVELVQFERVLRQEVPLEAFIARAPGVPALRDDRPINEYYFLRHLR